MAHKDCYPVKKKNKQRYKSKSFILGVMKRTLSSTCQRCHGLELNKKK